MIFVESAFTLIINIQSSLVNPTPLLSGNLFFPTSGCIPLPFQYKTIITNLFIPKNCSRINFNYPTKNIFQYYLTNVKFISQIQNKTIFLFVYNNDVSINFNKLY